MNLVATTDSDNCAGTLQSPSTVGKSWQYAAIGKATIYTVQLPVDHPDPTEEMGGSPGQCLMFQRHPGRHKKLASSCLSIDQPRTLETDSKV